MKKQTVFVLTVVSAALIGCGSDGGGDSGPAVKEGYVQKVASCGSNDKPETGLQGQIPASMRPAGFKGFSCNLELVGQSRNDGASWQHAAFVSKSNPSKKCAYYDTNSSTVNRTHLGSVALDVTDPTKPRATAFLTTKGMLDPWESLKVHQGRQILAADNGMNGGRDGGPQLDLYDISGDCSQPQLLSTLSIGIEGSEGLVAPVLGHEGEFQEDGLTYWGGDVRNRQYWAVDVTNTTRPKLLTVFKPNIPGGNVHGMSFSKDGNRAYFVSADFTGFHAGNPVNNGLIIADISEVQSRKANPQVKVVSTLFWEDGAGAQHTIPVKIGGKPYVIFVDETGPGGFYNATNWKQACDKGLPTFPMARIIDIADEKNPKVVSKLAMEIHDPANCAKVGPDLAGINRYAYGTHYCSVDDKENATILACGMFGSGIRVHDIRDVTKVKEIAYFNPPAVTTPSPGAKISVTENGAMNADFCTASLHIDKDNGQIWTTCQDNGFLALKFTNGAWPFR
jgi:hypothetical protein